MEPPPSPPVASATSPPATAAADPPDEPPTVHPPPPPPATAAAEPPDEPPTVHPWRHGLWVTPLILVMLTFSPPNSLAVVAPTGTAPPCSRRRSTWCEVSVATRSLKTREASVQGQPATGSSSLIPAGTPPKGFDTSAAAAACCARSTSMCEKQLRSEASMAARVASSSSRGERSPERKASTSEQASCCQGVSVTSHVAAARASGARRRPHA